jgi:hypothetical protein
MKALTLALGGAVLLVLSSCSEAPKPEEKKTAEAAKPAEPVTGRYALNQMYLAARAALGSDVEPLQCISINLQEVKTVPGKAAAWRCTFVSARAGKAKDYTYSVVESVGNLHKGVFAGLDESWSGPRGAAKPFIIAAIKTDTDAAYEVAAKKAKDYEKKNPGKSILFTLEKIDKFPDPAWRVIWGESVGTSNFSIFVDASTGTYLETMR